MEYYDLMGALIIIRTPKRLKKEPLKSYILRLEMWVLIYLLKTHYLAFIHATFNINNFLSTPQVNFNNVSRPDVPGEGPEDDSSCAVLLLFG